MRAVSKEHWNGNQVCAIDLETTGLDPSIHEIWQICVLPLDANFNIRKEIIPFYIVIKPEFPETASPKALSRKKLLHVCEIGFDSNSVKDMLVEWMKKLDLPCTAYGTPKKIIPLGHNYAFDKSFLQKWLGVEWYQDLFDYHYNDTMISAMFLNQCFAEKAEPIPFPHVGLSDVCSTLKIKNEKPHDALYDCMATAEAYQKMTRFSIV